jgi:hypothetical protein|tara:strand:- start:675 stop:887 length:213 start_codon:yes stop_codon:yes gene_type:complete
MIDPAAASSSLQFPGKLVRAAALSSSSMSILRLVRISGVSAGELSICSRSTLTSSNEGSERRRIKRASSG